LPANVENLMLMGTLPFAGTGNALDNVIIGNGANNKLIGRAGADHLDGGAGIDTASYAGSPSGVNVSLATGTGTGGDAEGDTLVNIERLIGSSFNDTLEGDAGNNVLRGGAGVNTVSYEHATAGVVVNLNLSTPQNTIGAGIDELHGFRNAIGSNFDDVLIGSGLSNTLSGLDGNDRLIGSTGRDVLIGGNGVDILTGNLGPDTFVFGPANAANADVITDFQHGVDKLRITGSDYGLSAGPLNPSNLVIGTAAIDAHAEFVFTAATRTLVWDPDGVGGADSILVATFSSPVSVTAGDFVVV